MKWKGWTCQRVSGGVKCRAKNPSRKRICWACGKSRPVKKRPAHMAALKLSYEHYVALNGGEACGICGGVQKPGGRRLHRDHCHRTGRPRGILCFRCNKALPAWMDADWLRAAARYLDRGLSD